MRRMPSLGALPCSAPATNVQVEATGQLLHAEALGGG